MSLRSRHALAVPAAIVLTGASIFYSAPAKADPDALWNLVDQRCVPAAMAGRPTLPTCSEVDLAPDRAHGWVVLKDLRGRLQFLLIPTEKITGIESPVLEVDDATNYFAKAWDARLYMDRLNGSAVPRDAVSLAINSRLTRSQNQLHIHVSCVRPDLRARLIAAQSDIGADWSALPGGWLRHRWFVRRIDEASLAAINLFADVADHVPDAAAGMPLETIGVVAENFSDGTAGFVLMASRVDPQDRSSGSAEDDLQDHGCAILGLLTARVRACRVTACRS